MLKKNYPEDEQRVLDWLSIDPNDDALVEEVVGLYRQGYAVRKICHLIRSKGYKCD